MPACDFQGLREQSGIGPAHVVKCLGGIKDVEYVDVVIRYGGEVIELSGVKLLRSVKGGASRQFTIPRGGSGRGLGFRPSMSWR
ncbi:hypothetical protein [Vulcanisaeta distributa]|uniref:hypothetical protein n=1 Tax=Vulcanisaeta distributa TaxID=164451 RepID=UPI0006D00D9D|nr:hypothetical protein [Vulcanisaeta distributa]